GGAGGPLRPPARASEDLPPVFTRSLLAPCLYSVYLRKPAAGPRTGSRQCYGRPANLSCLTLRHESAISTLVIRSFRDQRTADLFLGAAASKLRKVPGDVTTVARRKLAMVDAAAQLSDLRAPPGNRLETLKGDLKGYHSIRVNDKWRIV